LSGRSAAAADAAAALVPELARQLRELATGAGGGEHGVRGIGDPFLQAALLRLVRVAARGSAAAADAAGDVLALVGAQDDAAGNVATALLYECAVTALAIPAGAALRGLAVNVLGRLLARADNNARCVALGALATAVVADAAAVQRHRATVLARLRDDDATIRRRALDLAFALVDADNAPAVVREILRALPHVDADQRASAAYRLAAAVALFAASREWHVDRMLRLLAVAGAHVRARDLFRFLRLVAAADAPLQRRAARAAFALLERDVSQDKLVQAGVWLTGEYADLIVSAGDNDSAAGDNDSAGLDADGLDILGALGQESLDLDKSLDLDLPQPAPAPAAVVRLLASVARAPAVSPAARHMALTALAKAAGRFAALPAVVASVRAALAQHTHAVDAELQARAAEFDALLRRELDPVRAAVVERMPPPEYAEVPYDEYVLNPAAMRMKALTLFRPPELIAAADPAADPAGDSAARAEASRQSVVSDLLNLMDEAPTSAPISAPTSPPQPAVADLLAATSLSPPADAVAYPVFH
ncbi:clathrin associated protein complex large subunit, partial [Coemansia sp. RSA 2611]